MHTGKIQYHIIWCTKYRRDLLTEEVSVKLKELLEEKCFEKGWFLHSIEVMPDHVHCFVESDAKTPLKYIANQLKGFSSRHLRKKFKVLRTRVPSLWTRSYYADTIGHISEDVVKKYIENQKNV